MIRSRKSRAAKGGAGGGEPRGVRRTEQKEQEGKRKDARRGRLRMSVGAYCDHNVIVIP